MERKIGEIFNHKGVPLVVVEDNEGCKNCYFFKELVDCTTLDCCDRSDGKSVIFKRVDGTRELLTKSYKELVHALDELEEHLNKTK